MNVQDEIQRLGTQKGYTNISGLYYTMNEDVVINVLDLDNDNSGTVLAMTVQTDIRIRQS